jgi:two-component system, NarL family, response regulator LiaR
MQVNESVLMQKLLVVDDHAPTRGWLRSTLSNVAEQMLEAADGTEALEVYFQQKPDWVVMDLQMRDMDGLTATRLIKRQFPDARILVMTSQGEDIREAALASGAVGFLCKEDLWQLEPILQSVSAHALPLQAA